MFNFALPHAVTLAESGRSLKERRVGAQPLVQTSEYGLILV
jgi:hypothetical protein